MARFADKVETEIATIISIVCFAAGLVLSTSADKCRNLVFKEPQLNKVMEGHVIGTKEVINEGGCRVNCYMEPNCVSINVGPLREGRHQCDLNNATDDQFPAALRSKTGYTFLAIKNPCISSPCLNSGTCQAGFSSHGFRCICPPGILGRKCDGADLRVACFYGADKHSQLGDFTKEVKRDNTNDVVKKCAKLAKAKQYQMFALGKGGVCLSVPTMRYVNVGDIRKARCSHGIGEGNSMFVYSLEKSPVLETIGCYRDKVENRAFPNLYANFRGSQIDWNRMNLTVNQCARVAHDNGYKYFAIQFYGECYSKDDAEENYSYDKHGNSSNCWLFDEQNNLGVGKKQANFVYKILN